MNTEIISNDVSSLVQVFFMRHNKNFGFRTAVPNFHEDMEAVFVLSGRLNFRCGTSEQLLHPGDLCFIYPGTLHLLEYADNVELIYFMIKADSLKAFSWQENTRYYCISRCDMLPFTISALELIYSAARSGNSAPQLSDSIIRSFEVLFSDILKQHSLEFEVHEQNHQAMEIFQYINDHYTEALSIDSLAHHFYISSSYISRLLRTHCNAAPMEVLAISRIYTAANLLIYTDHTIQAISEECGYINLLTFQKAFKKRYGCSASDFRKRYREELPGRMAFDTRDKSDRKNVQIVLER